MTKTYKVLDEVGLHARPASLMVKVASKFTDEVHILYKGRKLTLKSIMAVMSLGVPYGDEFVIEVVGDNELQVFTEIEKVLIENNVI